MGDIGDAIVALINKAHPLIADFILFAVGLLIFGFALSILITLRKSISSQTAIDRLLSLQNEYNSLNVIREKYNQSVAIQVGIKSVHSELKYLFYEFASGGDIQNQAYGILKLITDRLSTDLKFSAGEIHRSAIWLDMGNGNLGLFVASSGFPDYYRNQRLLDINRSSAGRCFRTVTSDYIPDICKDKEFQHNPGSQHRYKSLICVPLALGELCLGVITVDGKKEDAFKAEDMETVEIYAEMAAIVRMMQIASIAQHAREEDTHAGENQHQNC